MRLDEQTPLVPDRDWDALIAGSMRRGRTLRRRRRAMLASPLAVVLSLAVAIPLSGAFAPKHDGLARLNTTNVGPDHSYKPGPAPKLSPLPAPPSVVTSGSAKSNPTTTARVHPVGPRPATAIAAPPLPQRNDTVRPVTLTYADVQGDATPQASSSAPQGPTASAASDPTLDITRMTFTGDRHGLRITMNLLGDYRTDGYYLAYFTDSRTGCAYTVWVGGAYHDQLNWACGSDTGARYLQATVDSARTLSATVPFDAIPGGVARHDTFTGVRGETRLVHPAGGQWPYDEASTSRTLRLP